jgi:hypothetical protein
MSQLSDSDPDPQHWLRVGWPYFTVAITMSLPGLSALSGSIDMAASRMALLYSDHNNGPTELGTLSGTGSIDMAASRMALLYSDHNNGPTGLCALPGSVDMAASRMALLYSDHNNGPTGCAPYQVDR